MQATVVSILASGSSFTRGAELVVLEAMKMEHVVSATEAGVVASVLATVGETVLEDQLLLEWSAGAEIVSTSTSQNREVISTTAHVEAVDVIDLDRIRPDLAEVLERHRVGLDDARPESVARRRKTGSEPLGKTSTILSTRTRLWNSRPWWWRPNVDGERLKT